MKKTSQGRGKREREGEDKRKLHVLHHHHYHYYYLFYCYYYYYCRLNISSSSSSSHQEDPVVDVNELMGRIQEYVSAHRIRACEYFQDFDPLRSGLISITRFRQVQYSTLNYK